MPLDDHLADLLIARTLDPGDTALRLMTRDLARFASRGKLAAWQPGRDLVCMQDDSGTLLGVFWIAEKSLPQRIDYSEPDVLHQHDLSLTCAIRTYGSARGRGLLTKRFAEHALERLVGDRSQAPSLWYETKAHNSAARALGRQLGFFEASGEIGGSVIGVRFGN